MEINTIAQLIANIGFPVVAFILMGWYILKRDAAYEQTVERLSNTIEKNNKVTQKLVDLFERFLGKDIDGE